MSILDSLLSVIRSVLNLVVDLLKGGYTLMFDLIASVLIILLIVEIIKWVKRH